MALEGNSNLVLMRVSTANDVATNGLYVVCEESSNANGSTTVSERKTKCGAFTSTNAPTYTISGSGVAVGDKGATEVSSQNLLVYMDARTTIYFVYQNSLLGTLTAGEVVYLAGAGRFSNVTVTADEGDGLITFDWEFAVSGAVDLTP